MKKNNNDLKTFLENSRLTSIQPLNPRDAFFGGRTGNVKTYYDVKKNASDEDIEKIHYVDVCSLYPWVLKNGIFPIGHPTVYVDTECQVIAPNNSISFVNGLIKCKVLPPRHLYHPVLPVRMHNKLFFPLCLTCCELQLQSSCPHENEKDRELYGTWVSCELQKAVDMGYIIKEIDEIWDYKVVQYKPNDVNNAGLFVDYINTFLKIKQEASGWPSHCIDEKSKQEYLSQYEQKEGIRLDRDKIEENPGLRSIAKLFLNSFWGKFGQRENMRKKSIVRTYEEFCDIVFNPEIEVKEFVPINQDTIFINWENNNDSYVPSNRANVAIAAFTTAQARLKLYSYLEELGTQVLYYDTDSVIYVTDNNRKTLETGDFLGDLTNELEKDHGKEAYITKFVSGGPKFYAYLVQDFKKGQIVEKCKLKGIKLNVTSSKLVNYDSIRSLVSNENKVIDVEFSSIRRDEYHQVLTKTDDKKKVQVTGPKRRRVGEAGSLPYGYKKIRRN